MAKKEGTVAFKEARQQVEIAVTRIALLHLAFSRILTEEFGEEKGKELVIRSISEYGKRIGDRVKKGLPDLPKYGVNGGATSDGRVYDCVFARVFQEYGERDLGSLYCYVDAAKSMAQDPTHKLTHIDCAACGDDFCSFSLVPTTEKEQSDFAERRRDWKYVDPRLARGLKR